MELWFHNEWVMRDYREVKPLLHDEHGMPWESGPWEHGPPWENGPELEGA